MAQTLSLSPSDNIRQQLQILTSGRSPIQPPPPQDTTPPAANMFEALLGSDFDATSVSPREMSQWYGDSSYGYGGPEHQQYIQNATKLFDEPLIPVRAAAYIGGARGYGPDSGDLSIRQVLENAPFMVEYQLNMELFKDPKNPEKKAAYERVRDINVRAEASPDQPHPLASLGDEVLASLTGQRPGPNAQYAELLAKQILGSLKSGVKGGKYENDPSIAQEELADLTAKYGEEANRMLTPGGVKNAKREVAFDFLAALQAGSENNPNFDNMTWWMSSIAPGATGIGDPSKGEQMRHRGEFTWDRSAMRGRMGLANLKLSRALPTFSEYEANPGKPYVLDASTLNRIDPGSYQGLMNYTSNASYPYARNVYHPFQPLVGDAWARADLAQGMTDMDPYRFQVQMLNNNQREAPVRMPGQDAAESRRGRDFVEDRLRANADYLPTHARPMLADMVNSFGNAMQSVAPHATPNMSRVPFNAERTAYSLPYAIGTSPPQAALVGLAAAKAPTLGTAASFAKEAIDENIEDAVIDPANANWFGKTQNTSWMRPYQYDSSTGKPRTQEQMEEMFNPDNREAWDRGVVETHARRGQELQQMYDRWRQLRAEPKNTEIFTVN